MVASSCCNIGRCNTNSGWMPKLMQHPAGMAQGTTPPALPVVVPIASKSPTVVAGSINTAGTSQPGLLQHKKAFSMNSNWMHICNSPSVCALSHLVYATPPYGVAPPHVDDLHQAITPVSTLCVATAMPRAVTTTLLHPAVAGNASLVDRKSVV